MDQTIAGYLCNHLSEAFQTSDSRKKRLLWKILFEIGIQDLESIEQYIYAYGSLLKEEDLSEREVFIGLVYLLQQIKNHQKNNL
ncbi:MAG: hypothetical protein J6R94_03455 [Agathobacter sp.]|nr:hypothetical protein [Agathobacter sp.]